MTCKPLFIIFFVACLSSTYAQQKALRVYSNLNYRSDETSDDFRSDSESELRIFPALSLSITKKDNFHEFGLASLEFDRDEFEVINNDGTTTSGAITKTFFFRLRYSYNMLINKNGNSETKFYLGISASPYYWKQSIAPKISTSFLREKWEVGAFFSLVPRVKIPLSDNLFVDINIPLNVADSRWEQQRINNPQIPMEQQKINGIELDTFPSFLEFNLGLGLNI